ncbi:CooT family nickel-binding protein [Thermoproteota archaeon]
MCELKVIIENKIVFKNAIYAKETENKVIIQSILGQTKEFQNHTITEVNITKEQLILTKTNTTSK